MKERGAPAAATGSLDMAPEVSGANAPPGTDLATSSRPIGEVDDLVNTIDVLNQYDVRVHGDETREVWVMPEAAGGVLLSFQSPPHSTPA